ncbi:MAG: hypothetical protein M1379_14425 [Firmicutes bacterium]|nr:hypothetical protein [Bacillota bacterium]
MSARRLTVQALRTLRAEIENDLAAIDRVVVQGLAIFAGHASSAVPPSLAIQMALALKNACFFCQSHIYYTLYGNYMR